MELFSKQQTPEKTNLLTGQLFHIWFYWKCLQVVMFCKSGCTLKKTVRMYTYLSAAEWSRNIIKMRKIFCPLLKEMFKKVHDL